MVFSAEQFRVSAYAGSSKNLKDLESLKGLASSPRTSPHWHPYIGGDLYMF